MTVRRCILPIVFLATACSAGATSTTTIGGVATTPPTTVGDTTTTVAVTTTMSPLPLAGKTVVIDPGHNGMNWAHADEISHLVDIGNGSKACNTTGTATSRGYTEPEFAWTLAQMVVTLLQDQGAEAMLTRQDNAGWGPCVNERAAIGNENRADAVVSIHADGGPDDGRGYHVIYPSDLAGLTDDIHDESKRLAEALHDSFLTTSMPIADYVGDDGYSERSDLGGLNLSDVPAVFLEAGNMRNEADASLLTDPGFQMEAAAAIVAALVQFLNG